MASEKRTIAFIDLSRPREILESLKLLAAKGFTGRISGLAIIDSAEREYSILVRNNKIVAASLDEKEPVDPRALFRRLLDSGRGFVELEEWSPERVDIMLEFGQQPRLSQELNLQDLIRVLEEKVKEEERARAQFLERLESIFVIDKRSLDAFRRVVEEGLDIVRVAKAEAERSSVTVLDEKSVSEILSMSKEGYVVLTGSIGEGKRAVIVVAEGRVCAAGVYDKNGRVAEEHPLRTLAETGRVEVYLVPRNSRFSQVIGRCLPGEEKRKEAEKPVPATKEAAEKRAEREERGRRGLLDRIRSVFR